MDCIPTLACIAQLLDFWVYQLAQGVDPQVIAFQIYISFEQGLGWFPACETCAVGG